MISKAMHSKLFTIFQLYHAVGNVGFYFCFDIKIGLLNNYINVMVGLTETTIKKWNISEAQVISPRP